jgi:putative transposase
LGAKSDKAAAKHFFDKAMLGNDAPEKITMDKSDANKTAIDEINACRDIPIVVRQVKHLNNIVEQDHRAVKRVTRPMCNFKSFRPARNVLAGTELMHMIRKDQMIVAEVNQMSFAERILYAGRINPSSYKGWHICSPEVCVFAVNATKPT